MPQPAAASCYVLLVMLQPLADMSKLMIIGVLIITSSNISKYHLGGC